MRRKTFSSTMWGAAPGLTGLTGLAALCSLGFVTGCTDPMGLVDEEEEKRRRDMAVAVVDMTAGSPDMARPPGDMASPPGDMSTMPADMSTTLGDMSMTPGDMAMTPADMAMPPADMAMMPADMAMMPADMSMMPPDMSMMPPDMSMMPPDMTMPPSDMSMSMPDMTTTYTCRGLDAPGALYQTVSDALRLPNGMPTRAYTYDYDGSGRAKNQLRALVNLVALAGLDLQGPIDDAVKNGLTLQLASLKSASLTGSSCVGVQVIPAKPARMPPKFDGTDMLEKAMTTPANLIGSITAGKLSTKASRDLLPSEDAVLDLQINIGAMAMTLPIHGLHVEGTVERVGAVTRIKDGIMHGVVAQSDIDLRIFPAVAATVTGLINSDPMGSVTKTLIMLFEDTSKPASAMKCMTPSKCCKTNPSTCVILPAEIKASVIGSIIVPDVEVFDAMGNWKPVRGGTSPNGMTVGVGFTSVTATYP